MNTNQTKWYLDQAHCNIAFSVRHLMISHVKGNFKTFDASIITVDKDFTSAQIDLWINTASVNTGDEKRDAHLRSAEFFDVANHEQISFISNTIGQIDEHGMHEIWGDLSMKGITKNIKLMAKFGGVINDPWGNERAGFTISGSIHRKDWGLVWNDAMEFGSIVVGEDIDILCNLEMKIETKINAEMVLDESIV
jgi:polyisoprenoid-binding protein YceI